MTNSIITNAIIYEHNRSLGSLMGCDGATTATNVASGIVAIMTQSPSQKIQNERRVALWVTQEEADAFLTILLSAPLSPHVRADVAEDLLIRIAEAQRELSRSEVKAAASSQCPNCFHAVQS